MMERTRLAPALLALLLVASRAVPAAAEPPRVSFDCPATLACRETTTAEFAEKHPDEKLIEARFPISLLARGGETEEMLVAYYLIESLERTLRVEDFEPKTTLASDVVGNIAVEQKEGRSRSLGLALNGGYDHYLKGTANASQGSDKSESRRYEVAPPLDLLAASGTVNRGAGVYFKLRPSSQTSLEGERQFTVVFRVPIGWRGGYVRLTCDAAHPASGGSSPFDEPVRNRRAELNIGLYLEGDSEARLLAEQFADAGFDLRRIVAEQQRAIRKRSLPTPLHQMAAMMSVVEPKIPSTWLRHAMLSPADAPAGDYLRHLPVEVRDAANAYRTAKLQLHLLNGKEPWRVELLKPAVE